MHLTQRNMDCINKIAIELNRFDNKTDRIRFLRENAEALDSFFSGLKNVDKLTKNVIVHEKRKAAPQAVVTLFTMEDVASVFHKMDNEQIIKTYKLKELQEMYYGIYKKLPISSYNKAKIVSVIRNRIYAYDRIEGFNQLAKERK